MYSKNLNIISSVKFDVVVSSSLRRARQTACLYGFDGHIVEPLLNELDFGLFEGRSKSELIKWADGKWENIPGSLTLGEELYNFGDVNGMNRFKISNNSLTVL